MREREIMQGLETVDQSKKQSKQGIQPALVQYFPEMVTRILAIRPIRVQPRIFLKSQQASEICHITDHIMIVPVLVTQIHHIKQKERPLHCPTSWFVVVVLHNKHQKHC